MRKTSDQEQAAYQERISELDKRLSAAVEEHRRMRRELESLEDRDPFQMLMRGRRPLPHLDDDARN